MNMPEVGIERGELICPCCWSRCLVRSINRFRKTIWVWWCGCGWTSEEHGSPDGIPALIQRFANWKRLNGWGD